MSERHDCEKWHDEGRGCSVCSSLINHSLDDAKALQAHINGVIVEQQAEILELKVKCRRLELRINSVLAERASSYARVGRIAKWVDNGCTPAAVVAFTEGLEREVAYLVEGLMRREP